MTACELSARQPALDEALDGRTRLPAFMDLTVPEYAYMYGFLQADGHLSGSPGRKGRLTVEISAKDRALLESFQELTPYPSSIRERSRATNFSAAHRSALWSVCSLAARTTLNELGMPYGRKSSTIAPPRREFSGPDYLRGIVDADGSVGFTRTGVPFVSLTTESGAIAAYFCEHANEVSCVVRAPGRNARDGVLNVMVSMEHAQALAAHLYPRGCLSLERKQRAAAAFSAWKRPEGMRAAHTRKKWTAREDRLLLRLDDPDAASQELGRTRKSCVIRLWRLRHGEAPLPPAEG